MTIPTRFVARDFSALVHKLYFAHGLSERPNQLYPGTNAQRQAIQRLYAIRPDHRTNRFVAVRKEIAQ